MSPRWTVTPSWKWARPPRFIAPCLPVVVDNVPAGPGWLHELKWDGYRIIARKEGSSVRLWSRTGRGWHPAFPGIVEAIAALPATSLILDGEAVMLRNDGSADFFALRSKEARAEARLIVFDLLEVDGQDTRAFPLEERREHLAAVLAQCPSPSLLFSEAVEEDKGAVLFRHACDMDLEGIVSKRKGHLRSDQHLAQELHEGRGRSRRTVGIAPFRLVWLRAGDRYPELADDLDHFIALDGEEEVGVVKWVETGPDHGWFWSMRATAPGPAFKRPTFGQCATRGQAARELGACWGACRAYYGIED